MRPLEARWGRGWIPGGAPRPPPRVRPRYYSEARQRNPEHPERPPPVPPARHAPGRPRAGPSTVLTRAARGKGHRILASPLPPRCAQRCSRPSASAGRKSRPRSAISVSGVSVPMSSTSTRCFPAARTRTLPHTKSHVPAASGAAAAQRRERTLVSPRCSGWPGGTQGLGAPNLAWTLLPREGTSLGADRDQDGAS